MESLGRREADGLQSQTAITQVYPVGRAATTQHAEKRLFARTSSATTQATVSHGPHGLIVFDTNAPLAKETNLATQSCIRSIEANLKASKAG